MSLFQAREWWSTRNGCDEEFDDGCLLVANVDDDPTCKCKLVTGSFNGMLRVFLPKSREFKIEDLLAEEQLEFPILQLAVGKFMAASSDTVVAVLHPKHLMLYGLESVGGKGAAANYYNIAKKFSHQLGVDGEHFTSFNMVTGPFGDTRGICVDYLKVLKDQIGRDSICVQSLDGRLQFFEQDSYAFTQQFQSCMIPGPLMYVADMDSILTGTSELQLECYRYQVLATATCVKKDQEESKSQGLSAQKKLKADWKLNLGERIVALALGRVMNSTKKNDKDIIALTEHSMFFISCKGEIRSQKRLGYMPSAMTLYDAQSNDSTSMQNIIIATHSKQWMIYQDTQLVWSATTISVPVALGVGQFGNTPGMIVSLDEEGSLVVNYLGTDPMSTAVGATETKEIDYEEIDAEHRELLGVIRSTQGENRVEPRERVLLRAQVPTMLDHFEQPGDDFRSNANDGQKTQHTSQLTVRVFVTYTGKGVLRNVTISINTPEGVIANQSSILLSSIDGSSSTPLIIPVVLCPVAAVTPASLELSISAAYNLEAGQPRTSIYNVKLPLIMCCTLVPPVKTATFKFTLDTNQDPMDLSSIFEDMLSQPGHDSESMRQLTGSANVMSFRYYNGVDVSILVSKNAGRYRIQSNELEALWLITDELCYRLQNGPNIENLEITYTEPLPLADFFESIDHHFSLRQTEHQISTDLNNRSHQFRVIQKRLLVRFKDRNPAALNHLDTLLHGTYEQIIFLAEQLEQVQAQLKQAANRLSCSVSLINKLIRYRFQLSDASFAVLCSHLSSSVVDSLECGWEEITDAAMTHLLRTCLAKSAKESAMITSDLQMAPDTSKVKKHITIVLDRMSKGATLIRDEKPRNATTMQEGKE